MTAENRVTMEPELRSMLGRHREELLRRALALAISRSTLEELVERPLDQRLDELELLFEAASPEAGGESGRVTRNRDLRSELDHQLAEHEREGRIFSVAVIAAGRARIARLGQGVPDRRPDGPDARAWANALRECAAPHGRRDRRGRRRVRGRLPRPRRARGARRRRPPLPRGVADPRRAGAARGCGSRHLSRGRLVGHRDRRRGLRRALAPGRLRATEAHDDGGAATTSASARPSIRSAPSRPGLPRVMMRAWARRELISIDEARERVLAAVRPLPAEDVELPPPSAACSPPTPWRTGTCRRSTRRRWTASRCRPASAGTLRIDGESRAGAPATAPLAPGTACRISTGAVVPEGTHAVVPVERDRGARRRGRRAGDARPARTSAARARTCARARRSSRAGTEIGPAELAVLASLGLRGGRVRAAARGWPCSPRATSSSSPARSSARARSGTRTPTASPRRPRAAGADVVRARPRAGRRGRDPRGARVGARRGGRRVRDRRRVGRAATTT